MESNTNTTPVAEAKACSSKECKCKGKKGLIAATILTTVLAIGGVGFGVYGMMKANSKPEQKSVNPILDNGRGFEFTTDANYYFKSEGWNWATGYPKNSKYAYMFGIDIWVTNGKITGCSLTKENETLGSECKIEGLEGRIYQIAEIYDASTQDDTPLLAFLLEDGTISYTDLTAIEPTDTTIKIQGKLKIDKPVSSIIVSKYGGAHHECTSDNCAMNGNYLRLSDDTYTTYSKDMLQ